MFYFLSLLLHPPLLLLLLYNNQIDEGYEKGINSIIKNIWCKERYLHTSIVMCHSNIKNFQEYAFVKDGCQTHVLYYLIKDCQISILLKI